MNLKKSCFYTIFLLIILPISLLPFFLAVSCEGITRIDSSEDENILDQINGDESNEMENQNYVKCNEKGFHLTFAKEEYKKAFVFSDFSRDEITGKFEGEMNIKLDEITYDNGFVANHMWFRDKNLESKEELRGPFLTTIEYNPLFPTDDEGEGALIFGSRAGDDPERRYKEVTLNSVDDNLGSLVNANMAGLAPQSPTIVFAPNTLDKKWLTQAMYRNDNSSFSKGGTGGEQGDNASGGWQKLFTITACNGTQKVSNGFAVANLDTKFTPELTYTKNPVAGKVSFRENMVDGDKYVYMDSFVSNDYSTDTGLGLFTVRHYAPSNGGSGDVFDNLTTQYNVLTTRGALVCRSVIKLDKASDESFLKGVDSDETGESKLSLTCYLGLTALWPNVFDTVARVKELHTLQMNTVGKKESGNFDLEDKEMNILMINTSNLFSGDNLIKPILSSVSTSDFGNVEEDKDVVDILLANESIEYFFGKIKMKFDYVVN